MRSQGVEHQRSCVTRCSHCSNINNWFPRSPCRCSGTSPKCGGSWAQWFVDSQSAVAAGQTAASKGLMEEEVTEPDPQPTSMLPLVIHSEVNGDLPGNPYLRDGEVDMKESPTREPVMLQDSAEYSQTHQYG